MATGWALDAPGRAYEVVGRVQTQLERLLRQLGDIWRDINGLEKVSFRYNWADMILRLH